MFDNKQTVNSLTFKDTIERHVVFPISDFFIFPTMLSPTRLYYVCIFTSILISTSPGRNNILQIYIYVNENIKNKIFVEG